MKDESYIQNEDENSESGSGSDFWEILGGVALAGLAGYGVYKLGEYLLTDTETQSHYPPQLESHLQHAEIAMQESRFADAEYFASQSLKTYPNNPFALNILSASILNQNKDDDKALDFGLKAMRFIGNDEAGRTILLDNLTNVYFVRGDWQNAIKNGIEYINLFKKLYNTNFPPNSWCLDRVAKAYMNNHQFEEAVNYLEQSIRDSNNSRVYDTFGNLGFTRFRLNQFRLSIEAYENAIKMLETSKNVNEEYRNLNLSIFYNWLGVLYGKIDEKNKNSLCFTHYTNAIEKDPKNPYPYINIAVLYAEREDNDKLDKSLEKGIALIDKTIDWHKDLVSYILNKEELLQNERTKQFALNLLKSKGLINKDTFEFLASSRVAKQDFLIDEKQRSNLKKLIGEGELDKAFDELLPITREKNTVHNEVLILLGDFTQTNRQFRLGIITSGDCKPVINRISQALLLIIDKLSRNGNR